MVALIKLESVAASNARKASFDKIGLRLGSTTLNAATTIPIELKFAKPHKPKEMIAAVCGEIEWSAKCGAKPR